VLSVPVYAPGLNRVAGVFSVVRDRFDAYGSTDDSNTSMASFLVELFAALTSPDLQCCSSYARGRGQARCGLWTRSERGSRKSSYGTVNTSIEQWRFNDSALTAHQNPKKNERLWSMGIRS